VQTSVTDKVPLDLGFAPEHIAVVRNGLVGVVNNGTSSQVFAGAGYQSAGKTGTAQAVTIGQKDKYNAAKLAEHQRDHALYMAYAPVESPKIAVAVVVENAGFGAASAAPIARRVFDYWLLGQYPSEEDLAATQKGLTSRPVGVPRAKQDVPVPVSKTGN
jgi:penicillin-binding protein 2